MSWPLSDEINEAIQTPSLSFADPDLKGGQPVLGATGLPLPRSGNFADVYQIVGPDGREWAVKCFTRPATGLDKRYEKVSACLGAVQLPFTVPFAFLKEGIRIRGQWYPVVKMQWVEGLQLNQFVRENAARPAMLDSLATMWAKLAHRLRDAGIAHADLQHGNVMLVSGAKAGALGLRLLDYDGMYVPTLANQPSGERGHAAFQHPERAAHNVYSPDLDRFPHLVVATALKGLAALGKGLWDRHDTGDNLLFTEADFKNPAASKLLRELWQLGNLDARVLAGRLAVACKKPITQTPWFDQIAPDGHPTPLTADEEREASVALGVTTAAKPVAAVPVKAAPVAAKAREEFDFEEDESQRPERASGSKAPLILAAVAVLAVLGAAGVSTAAYFFFLKPGEGVAQTTPTPALQPLPTSPPVATSAAGGVPPPAPVTPDPKQPKTKTDSPAPPQAGKSSYQTEVVQINFPPEPPDARVIPVTWSVVMANPRSAVPSLATFTADGKKVAVSRFDTNEIVILDAATGNFLREINTNLPPVGLLPLADGSLAAHLVKSNSTTVFDPETGNEVRKIPTANYDHYTGENFLTAGDRYVTSPNGRYFGGWRPINSPSPQGRAQDEPGVLSVYDSETRQPVVDTLTGRGRFRVSHDGLSVILVESQGRLKWFNLATKGSPSEVKFANDPSGWVAALSPDATRFLYYGVPSGDSAAGLHLMDAASGQSVLKLPRRYEALSTRVAGLTVGGTMIALRGPPRADKLNQLDLLDGRTGKLLGVIPLNDPSADIYSMTFSPDGSRLLLARGEKGRFQVIQLPFEVAVLAPPTLVANPTPKNPQGRPKNTPGQPKDPPVVGKRLPVPADDAVAKAEADIREVYKAEFAKKAAPDKRALAQTLLDLADKTPDDPTARFAMLRLAQTLASEAGDSSLAIRTIDTTGRYYDLPTADLKVTALEKVLASTTHQATLRELAELAISAADAAMTQDAFDAAVKLTQVAATAARRSVMPGADEFDARLAAVKKLRDAFADVKTALTTLATMPNDPAANQVVGKFRCFLQGRWADGVKHLARGDSLLLKTAADAELEDDSAKAADAWWEVSQVVADPAEKKQASARAKTWYLKALPKLTGLALARAQTRLAVTINNITYGPGLIAEFASKSPEVFKGAKGRIDTIIEYNGNEFTSPKGGVTPPLTIKWSGVVLAPKPGRYKLTVTVPDAMWDVVQVTVNKTIVAATTKKNASAPGKAEAVVTLTDKPIPLVVTFQGYASPLSGLKMTWVPVTALGEGEPVSFAESYFHDKKAESVLK